MRIRSRHKKLSKLLTEKRKNPRIRLPRKRAEAVSRGRKVVTECLDIGGGGLGLLMKKPLGVGGKIEIYFDTGKDRKPLIIRARVIWAKRRTDGFHVGLKFLKIKNKREFIEFLRDAIL